MFRGKLVAQWGLLQSSGSMAREEGEEAGRQGPGLGHNQYGVCVLNVQTHCVERVFFLLHGAL